MVVIWGKSAETDLIKAYDYISLESPQNAILVLNTLVDLTLELPKHPKKYALDKFKRNNDGSWRAFEKYNYRISYRILKIKFELSVCGTQKNPPYDIKNSVL